jgi:serine/threonine protein kinase
MPFSAGTKLGTYEIVGPLGAGGMGEVYRARDSKLKREVAIKVLPDAFARDAERVARFQREAEVLASLNHPHIAAIYDLAEFGESRFLVLELVEGETLAERIARGRIALDESLAIAKQIADALEAAHEKGIIHRDLKPANIKFTAGGDVKVLDFGLAKVREPQDAGANMSVSPTLLSASTPGMIMGTAAYMSPEQAKGKETDRMSDVWAFGCVLFEMLAGRVAFEGGTISEIFAEILKAEPDWRLLPAETPEGIRYLLRRCLQKERKRRLRDMADARIEIEDVQTGAYIDSHRTRSASRPRERLLWLLALALVTVIATIAIARTFRPVPPAPEVRLEITTPPTTDPTSIAISPDGQKIVFAATSEGRSQLWLRSLDSVSARPLPGTDFASLPFWSPDSRSLGFFADSKLKRIDLDGGSVQTLANAGLGMGGAWNRDGTILFVPRTGPILRLAESRGEPVALTRLEAQQRSHRHPQFLPDGRHFLYYVPGVPEVRGVYVGQLDGSESRRLLVADTAAVYASPGQLLFVRQGTLFAQNFDPVRLAVTGNPFPVAEQIAVNRLQSPALSASAAGPLIYRTGSSAGQRQFVWLDRSGREIGKVGDPDVADPSNPSMSPDSRRVALSRSISGNTDIWLLETARGLLSRFTFDAEPEAYPIWSPDGSHITFSRSGLYEKPAAGTGNDDLLLATPTTSNPTDWSPDGRFLLYRSVDQNENLDIWALPMEGDRKPFPVVQTNFRETDGQFSPDGRWIAYQSDESGRFEIYVQRFPGPGGKVGGKWLISTNGGAQVRWRRDGQELFYIALDGRLMAVAIRLASSGQAVEAGAPVPLFATHVGGAVQGVSRQQYIVSVDGQRFLMNTVTEDATAPITVILNWKAKS